ncbi:MAG: hypothetical protein JF595_07555 [Sphingomonadales bacterium]|nr:hypothetical protein [Sphingomonadales bacterium]
METHSEHARQRAEVERRKAAEATTDSMRKMHLELAEIFESHAGPAPGEVLPFAKTHLGLAASRATRAK